MFRQAVSNLARKTKAPALAVAKLDDIDLRQHSKDHLYFRLNARMVQLWTDVEGKERDKTCRYRHNTERIPAETWLASGTEGFRAAMQEGFEAIAVWMNRDLEAFANETEFEKSESGPGSCYREPRWYD